MTNNQLDFLCEQEEKAMTSRMKEALRALKEGKPILLQDASERENEGDLVVAAEKINSTLMNFLIKKGSGVVCMALSPEKLEQLGLPMMLPHNTNLFQTAFTVSIEAKTGVTTGVSAQDRAHTFRTAIADGAKPSDLRRPGHVFPLAAKAQGVFERMGHTEGSIDLMKIAGLKPGAALCELMNSDGSMSVGHQCIAFASEHAIPIISVEEVLFHRIRTEDIVLVHTPKCIATRFGKLMWHRFTFLDTNSIELFVREDFNSSCLSPLLTIAVGDNLLNRFVAQILHNFEDDPFFAALSALKERKTDIVALMPAELRETRLVSNSDLRRQLAFLCRALLEMSVTSLNLSHDNGQLNTIAEYFSIKTN